MMNLKSILILTITVFCGLNAAFVYKQMNTVEQPTTIDKPFVIAAEPTHTYGSTAYDKPSENITVPTTNYGDWSIGWEQSRLSD